jgi:translation initiation factor 1
MKTKLVFTTDPEEAKRLRESSSMPRLRDAAPGAQNIRVMLDRKRRGGKTVTVANGFELSPESLEKLAGQLKKRCGAGGTAKDREIEIQGDHAEAVIAELTKLGYRVKRAGG